MVDLHDLQFRICLHCLTHIFFLRVNDSGCDEDSAVLEVRCDLTLKHDDDRSKNVCHNDVVALVSCLILNCLVIDDISLNNAELLSRNVVCLEILPDCNDCILIKIGSKCLACAELQSCDSKDSASGSDIENLLSALDVFVELTDAKLSRFMFSGSEGCSRVNFD